jgi:RNA polymerase subunit RPABC4/transcription elongation factor Spt4
MDDDELHQKCLDCGWTFDEGHDICPNCGSENITEDEEA